MGRLDSEALEKVEDHIAECDDCATAVGRIQSDQSTIRVLLDSGRPEPETACLDAEVLARYFDGSLDPEEADSAEEHLSDCRSCQGRLTDLREELVAVRGGQETPPLPLDDSSRVRIASFPSSKTEVPSATYIRAGRLMALPAAVLGIVGALAWPEFEWRFHFVTLAAGTVLLKSRQVHVERFLGAAADRLILVSLLLYAVAWLLPIVSGWFLLLAVLVLFAWASVPIRKKSENVTQSSTEPLGGEPDEAERSSQDSTGTG